jgi:isochorismate synthase
MTAGFVREDLIELTNTLGDAVQRAGHRSVLVSLTDWIPSFDAVTLFENSTDFADRVFWKQDDVTFVGIGAAHVIEAHGADRFMQIAAERDEVLGNAVVRGDGAIFFGGFAFDVEREKTALWREYPDGRLVLPRLLFAQTAHGASLTFNIMVTGDTDADTETLLLAQESETLLNKSGIHVRNRATHADSASTLTELRPADEWKAEVAAAADAIANGELEKTVLARAVRLTTNTRLDTALALRRLLANYPECYVFAFAHGGHTFLGATPERLVRLRGGMLRTMSLAGSIRRGATPAEDDELGAALFNSAKDRQEHRVVVGMLRESLLDVCDSLDIPDVPQLLKLSNVQHLCTPISGHIVADASALDVVERLHPTPAVGGRPRETALKLIREREGMDRGWYAAPVGWIDAEGDGEFAVALRSALVDEARNEATLFAGCGIVADSDPEREYAESALKLKPMLNALTS